MVTKFKDYSSRSKETQTQSHKELVGKGNIILCSADVVSAYQAGVLDYTPALNANLNVDDTGNTFAGVLQGKYRVYMTHILLT